MDLGTCSTAPDQWKALILSIILFDYPMGARWVSQRLRNAAVSVPSMAENRHRTFTRTSKLKALLDLIL